MRRSNIAGVDLSVTRASSVAHIVECIDFSRLRGDELLNFLSSFDVVVVDAPLSRPKDGAFRAFEKRLLSRGFRLLPLTLGSMSKLADLGCELRRRLEGFGVAVYETHPRTARVLMGLSEDGLIEVMSKYSFCSPPRSKDDLDALTCLAVGLLHTRGLTEVIEESGVTFLLPLPESVP